MNYKMIGKFISRILILEAAFMLVPLVIALVEGTRADAFGFIWSILLTVAAGTLLGVLCRNENSRFQARDGLVCVGCSWIAMSIFGCLPFYLSGSIPHFVDALFEIVSGFTTTGSSILSDVEALSRSILYWRSFSHWVGGMGVLVFLLGLTSPGVRGSGFTMHLLRAESPGPDVGKLVPHMRDTAKILYLIYIGLTVLNFFFLKLGDMDTFEAICTAFGTAGTGGFGVKNDSIAGYSPYIQNVCTVFMLLFGINFSCYFLLLVGHVKEVFKDEELRCYLGMVLASIALIAFNIRGLYETLEETVRHAAFQVASIVTTTGFATTDFDLWPSFSKTILLCLMFVGACAGSTGGGMKVGRLLLIFKNLRRSVHRFVSPSQVQVVRNNDRVISEEVLNNTNAYLAAYGVLVILSFIIVSLDGFSITTNFSAVVSCFNNIGPGLEAVGPTCNFGGYSDLSKIVLTLDMLAGRLEIFPILVLFSRRTWKR